jgi:hypothetical protein
LSNRSYPFWLLSCRKGTTKITINKAKQQQNKIKYGEKLKDFFSAEGVSVENLYNADFVAKIRKAEKQPSKKIDLSKYGISLQYS